MICYSYEEQKKGKTFMFIMLTWGKNERLLSLASCNEYKIFHTLKFERCSLNILNKFFQLMLILSDAPQITILVRDLPSAGLTTTI